MKNTSLGQNLATTINNAYERLSTEFDNHSSGLRPAPGKWSPKQIIGHLIDSASNNHQRFVRGNFQENLVFKGYQQEEWVRLHAYQEMDWHDLLTLWKGLNLLIVHISLKPCQSYQRKPCHPYRLKVCHSYQSKPCQWVFV